jgi:hypothetical protein
VRTVPVAYPIERHTSALTRTHGTRYALVRQGGIRRHDLILPDGRPAMQQQSAAASATANGRC